MESGFSQVKQETVSGTCTISIRDCESPFHGANRTHGHFIIVKLSEVFPVSGDLQGVRAVNRLILLKLPESLPENNFRIAA
jgi:hypothetical protein